MGYITVNLRPIRIAFLVDPNDRKAILRAIRINTCLWGGIYNPIVPVFKRLLKVWADDKINRLSYRSIINGYIDAFDPDYFVVMGNLDISRVDKGYREIIKENNTIRKVEDAITTSYGLGLFEILDHFIEQELKYVRREPLKICIPKIESQYGLLISSLFGSLENRHNDIFEKAYMSRLDAMYVECKISDYYKFFKSDILYLSRLSSLYIDKWRIHSSTPDPVIFYMDATKNIDIIDYWNLRAAGWRVMPLPKQSCKFDEVRKFIVNFIDDNYPRSLGGAVQNTPLSIIKSRSCNKNATSILLAELDAIFPKSNLKDKVVHQWWYPRIWDRWARENTWEDCAKIVADSKDLYITETDDKIEMVPLKPKFLSSGWHDNKPIYANEIEFKILSLDKLYAEVMPEGKYSALRTLGVAHFNVRFSSRGITFLNSAREIRQFITLPDAEEIFKIWLQYRDWKSIELSQSGRMSKQILGKLGGIVGIRDIADESIIRLLTYMAGGEGSKDNKQRIKGEESVKGEPRYLNYDELKQRVKKIQKMDLPKELQDTERKLILNGLIQKILQLGLYIKCPICTERSWYSLNDISYEMTCHKCGDHFAIPSESTRDLIAWKYRTKGPFALKDKAHGAYSVLLTLRFFTEPLLHQTTPILSFKARKNQKEIEIDLALFYKELFFGKTRSHLIFCECKTHKRFSEKDRDRMKIIAEEFPGAVLVFSTLNKSLTEKEKKLIRPFVNKYRKGKSENRPANNVLVLTSEQLFSFEPRESFGQLFLQYGELNAMCDASHIKHLGLISYSDWLRILYNRKKQKVKP